MRRLGSPLFILLAGVVCTAFAQRPSPTPSPTPLPTPPKPGLAVVLQRQAIRENDELEAQVWISNEWDKALSEVTLRVNTPAFVSWSPSSCADWKKNSYQPNTRGTGNIGTIGPNDFRVTTICLKSVPDIIVGDYNLAFTCEYAWPMGATTGRSFVTAEKTLKANFLGSDTVAGVPLALASLIVPGLVFWLVLGWMDVPWSVGSALGDKLVYSVIVSVVLLWLLNLWKPDPSGAIGLSKLFYYALAGAVAALLVGGVDRTTRFWWRRREAKQAAAARAAQVKVGDEPLVLLRKLLAANPNGRRPRAVVTAGQTTYTGSLLEETDEIVAIVGWFRIVRDNVPAANRAEIIQALAATTQPVQLYNIATKYNLTIEPRNGIREHTNDNDSEDHITLIIERKGAIAEQHFDTDEDDVIVVE